MKATAAKIDALAAGNVSRGVRVEALTGGTVAKVPTPAEIVVMRVRDWCREHGVPEPVTEHPFAKHAGRYWRFDFCWPAAMLAVEIQGGVYSNGRHTRPTGFAGDCEKMSTAAVMGWRVLPVTYEQCNDGRLLDWLRGALLAAAGPGEV